MSAVSGYWHISLIAMGGIAYNERILRDIKNLINVSMFSLFFVTRCIYTAALLYVAFNIVVAIIIIIIKYTTCRN